MCACHFVTPICNDDCIGCDYVINDYAKDEHNRLEPQMKVTAGAERDTCGTKCTHFCDAHIHKSHAFGANDGYSRIS